MKYQSVQNWVDYISYLGDEELFTVKVDWTNQDKTKIIMIVIKNHYIMTCWWLFEANIIASDTL